MSRKSLVPIVLPADPAAAMEAATKQYVDASNNEVYVGTTDPGTSVGYEMWYDTDAPSPPTYGLESVKPSSPGIPMTYFATDTKRQWFYDGTGWVIMAEPTQAWTPVWTQGVAITKTVASGYMRGDGRCKGWFRLTGSSAGTAAASILSSIPFAAPTSVGIYGTYQWYTAATGFRSGPMYSQSATSWSLQQNGLTTAGLTAPTIASGDLLFAMFDYEMASRYS